MKLIAICVVALLLAGTAVASSKLVSPTVVRNGGAELGMGASDTSSVVVPPGWTTTGKFTAVQYAAGSGFPDAALSQAIGGGNNFFAGGPGSPSSSASQMVKIPAAWASAVSRGRVKATLSATLGGFGSQRDYATATVLFLNKAGQKLGTLRVGPVTSAQRGGLTKLIAVKKTARVPAKARSVKIVVATKRFEGSYNDGYADNVSLTFVR